MSHFLVGGITQACEGRIEKTLPKDNVNALTTYICIRNKRILFDFVFLYLDTKNQNGCRDSRHLFTVTG